MIKVITTVGTSLFTNYMREEVQKFWQDQGKIDSNTNISSHYKLLSKQENPRASRIIREVIEKYWINTIKTQVDEDGDLKYELASSLNVHCCAEVQTLEAIKKEMIKKNKEYEIILLSTDTQLSKVAADIIKGCIYNKEKETREPITIKGLDVNDSGLFNDDGFKNLFDEVQKIKTDSSKGDELILNISGGYKGIIPIITLIGQLLDIDIVYMYENSTSLIQITKLPINFDSTLLEEVASYMTDDYLKTIDLNSDIYKYFDKYKLVKTDNNGIPKMSGVGKVLHQALFKGNLDNKILGTFIEYKMFHYFATSNNEKEIYTNPQIGLDDAQCYKVENGKYIFKSQLNRKGKKDSTGFKVLGDLDIALSEKEKNVFVLGEIKSHFQVTGTFYTDINTDKDYYKKIKARIEYWKKKKEEEDASITLKFLFIIHKIKILQNDTALIFDDNTLKVMEYFKNKIIQDYGGCIDFDFRGVWIDATEKLIGKYSELFKKAIKYDDFEFHQ